MTKHRAPLTFDAALARIAGQVEGGYDALALRCGRGARQVRNWGDPDTPDSIPVDVALDFDLAYAEAGGEGSPYLEAFAHQREQLELAVHASRVALSHRAADFVREAGEAGSALVMAALPGATAADRRSAVKEVADVVELARRTLPELADHFAVVGNEVEARERAPP